MKIMKPVVQEHWLPAWTNKFLTVTEAVIIGRLPHWPDDSHMNNLPIKIEISETLRSAGENTLRWAPVHPIDRVKFK